MNMDLKKWTALLLLKESLEEDLECVDQELEGKIFAY